MDATAPTSLPLALAPLLLSMLSSRAALADPYVQVDAGYLHTCAHTEAGLLTCWGKAHGEVRDAPKGAFVDVSAGLNPSRARPAQGPVTCGGQAVWAAADPDPQLDIGHPPPDLRVTQISIGAVHACVVTTDGPLRRWGDDQFGQISATPGAY